MLPVVSSSRVLLLGVSYKKDTTDLRESPALDILRLLKARGAKVSFHDPYNREIHFDGGPVHRRTPLTPRNLQAADLVIVVTDHSSYDYSMVAKHARMILDTRNATRDVKNGRAKIHRL